MTKKLTDTKEESHSEEERVKMVETQEFYVLALRKSVKIPMTQVKIVKSKGRRFAKSVYKVGKKSYNVSRILGKETKKCKIFRNGWFRG